MRVLKKLLVIMLFVTANLYAEEDKKTCFEIEQIVLENNTYLTQKQINEVTDKYKNKCIGEKEIVEIMVLFKVQYEKAGLIDVDIKIPKQNLKTGVIRFEAFETKVNSISFDKGQGSKAQLFTSFPLSKGDYLTRRELKVGVEQFNRVESNNATVILDKVKPGLMDVIVKNEVKKPIRLSYIMDNFGDRGIGQKRQTFRVDWDNLIGWNDQLKAGFRINQDESTRPTQGTETLPRQKNDSHSINYALPVRYGNLILTDERLMMGKNIRLQQLLHPLTVDVHKSKIKYIQLVHGDDFATYALNFELTKAHAKQKLRGQSLENYRVSTAAIGVIYDAKKPRLKQYAEINFRQGIRAFDASRDKKIPGNSRRAQYSRIEFNGSVAKAFDVMNYKGFEYRGAVDGQYSFDYLYSIDKLYLGGNDSVRGYGKSAVEGDTGLYLRQELVYHLPDAPQIEYLNRVFNKSQIFAAFDMGYARNHTIQPPHAKFNHMITGTALGIRASAENLKFELTGSLPITHPPFIRKNKGEVYASFTVTLP